jgi:CheY-like chemotaxis protein
MAREEPVARIRPVRVLIGADDERFGRVTAFLLASHPYDVRRVHSLGAVGEAASWQPDVALLEVERSRATAARVIGALQALPAPPAIVQIGDDGKDPLAPGIERIAKWATLELIVAVIDRASRRRIAPLH